jgi:hypothetical protein
MIRIQNNSCVDKMLDGCKPKKNFSNQYSKREFAIPKYFSIVYSKRLPRHLDARHSIDTV